MDYNNYPYGKAPDKILLEGDKTKKRESPGHIIEFPGGSISVMRVEGKKGEGDEYWAHIAVNKNAVMGAEGDVRDRAAGTVVGSRVDFTYERHKELGIPSLLHEEDIEHLAIRIKTS